MDSDPSAHNQLERKKAATQAYYDLLAPKYDEITRSAGRWPVNVFLDQVLRDFRPAEARSVLDLGAGTGQTLEVVASHVPRPERMVGVDVSEGMLSHLRRNIFLPHGVEAVRASLDDYLRDTDEQFDIVTSVGSLEFVPSLVPTVQDMYDRVIPGGLLFFTYEPVIPERAVQSARQTTYRSSEAATQPWEFTIFREDRHVVRQVLEERQAEVLREELGDAYELAGDMVQYCFVAVKRPLIH